MRQLLLSTVALVFLAAPGWAQPNEHRGERSNGGPQTHEQTQAPRNPSEQPVLGRPGHDRSMGANRGNALTPQANTPPAAPPQQVQQQVQQPGLGRPGHDRSMGANRNAQPDTQRDGRANGSALRNRDDGNNNRNDNGRGQFQGRRYQDNRPDINRDGRTDYRRPGYGGPRHDFSGFRDYHRSFHATRRFRAPSYTRPAGWYDHRWAFGEFLPTAFWARDYWLSDFSDYDLPPPPYGAVWVRVGRDALLVDEDSGEVITVEYDVFY